jgi:hypothetical protein
MIGQPAPPTSPLTHEEVVAALEEAARAAAKAATAVSRYMANNSNSVAVGSLGIQVFHLSQAASTFIEATHNVLLEAT